MSLFKTIQRKLKQFRNTIKLSVFTIISSERYNIFMTHMNMCNISLVLCMNELIYNIFIIIQIFDIWYMVVYEN